MKALKKIAVVAAVVLGLGMVVSCGMMPTELIDADFVLNEKDCSWAEGTWDVDYSTNVSGSAFDIVAGRHVYDGDSYDMTIPAGTGKLFVAELATAREYYGKSHFEAYVSPNRKMMQWTFTDSDGDYLIGTAAKM